VSGLLEVRQHHDVEQLGTESEPSASTHPWSRRSSWSVRTPGGCPVGPVYAQGAFRADQEGWVAQARKPSLGSYHAAVAGRTLPGRSATLNEPDLEKWLPGDPFGPM
jgi:hypothetical protein